MERIVERGCGVDVHKESVAACLRVPGANGQRLQEVRTFGTTAAELLALRDWLEGHGVTHVAMESTGVYWKPIYYVLEEAFTCLLVNAGHMQQVPGRKTDVQDATGSRSCWSTGCCGAASCRRDRSANCATSPGTAGALVQERSARGNRLHKVLEDADIKLASVATDVLGRLRPRHARRPDPGTTDPAMLADLARGALRKKLPALRRPSRGGFAGITRFWSARSWPTWTTSRRP